MRVYCTLQENAVFQLFTESMDWLFHKITEWCIKYGVKKQLKNCFNLPNNRNCCVLIH